MMKRTKPSPRRPKLHLEGRAEAGEEKGALTGAGRTVSSLEPVKPWEKTTLNLASSLLTPDSAYARWRPSLSRTLGAVPGGALGGTARWIDLPSAPATREPIADPRCRCLFPAQPSTGALASSSIAARRGRGSRLTSPPSPAAEGRWRDRGDAVDDCPAWLARCP